MMIAPPGFGSLRDKVIVVTGASSGIGKAAAILLSQLGAKIVLNARNVEKLSETVTQLNNNFHIARPFDLGNTNEIVEWINSVAKETGPISGIVHCAGIQYTMPAKFLDINKINNLMNINVGSSLMLAKAFANKKNRSKNSSMVFISSVFGQVGGAGVSAYAASKGAIVSLTKSLAVEYASENIRVNCILPGYVRTEMTEKAFSQMNPEQILEIEKQHPLGIGMPCDIANAVAFLMTDAARWITGSSLVVDGGYTAK